ncbi:hypothetical protein CPB83DRAFT_807207 [Crepidotus variabilis]|uniref:Enoyl reductase (ER) domain-containing protein n=1 Tax=Crepidotus variabilis TaxID=179855 RepID=A0A9P6EP68_9AGAR|nr:hypothetical protein CPB83DRAFT_807207 [Crepidotus variabilis]
MSTLIPPDVYMTDRNYMVDNYPMIIGFTVAGTIDALGAGIDDLMQGDRVTAFTYLDFSNRAMQEYSVQPRSVVSKIPDSLSLEEAATLPDNFVCAFYVLFNQLGLPVPSSFPVSDSPPLADTPILIYGASSTVGVYAVQLLQLAGYKKIIATASTRNHEYLKSLGATATFDYNSASLNDDIAKFVGGDGKVPLALDCISAESTLGILGKIIGSQGKVAVLLPIKEGSTVTGSGEQEMYWELPEGKNPFEKTTQIIYIRTFQYQNDEYLKKNLMPKILPSLLQSGFIKPSRVRLLDEGSFKERVEAGLELLRNNKVSGEKVIVKITA